MKLEDQVCALEYARKLKELNVNQESYFEWLYRPDLDKWEVSPRFKNPLGYSAFTVAELGEMLPSWCKSQKIVTANLTPTKKWCCAAHPQEYESKYLSADTEANARAKMLIYLIENGLVKV